MTYFDIKFVYSGIASGFTTLLFFIVSSASDKFTTPANATLIGAIISTLANFMFQFRILYPPHKAISHDMYYKYPIGHILDISTTYLGSKFIFDRKKKLIKYLPPSMKPYFNTIARLIVMTFLFLLISYPIRRYWIFA